jgi:hypothetical protein
VPRPTDKSEPSTLPDPALNPLLNPLLAAHMGRWAEVYFTNPPEKREQAVSELLMELENGSSARPSSQSIEDAGEVKKRETAVVPDPLPDAAELGTACGACGHNNPEAQRFCGMCGAPLHLPHQELLIEIAQSEPIAQASWQDPDPFLGTQAVAYPSEIEQDDRFMTGGKHPDPLELARPVPENELPQFAREPEPVPYRYRLYIGVVLAILLTVLLYMAWRGTQALSGIQQSPPSRIVPAAQPSPAATEPPAERNNVVPVEASPVQKKADKPVQKAEKIENPPAQPIQSAKPPDASAQKQQAAPAQTAPRMIPSAAATSSALASEQSSAQDLATAERYLNGTQGTNRDSREAVQWLWKAVGKGNPAATIALSDLYLRGVGVTKSCDQARLLLDAAARKGVKAAGDRLRNLQAFDCR